MFNLNTPYEKKHFILEAVTLIYCFINLNKYILNLNNEFDKFVMMNSIYPFALQNVRLPSIEHMTNTNKVIAMRFVFKWGSR